MFEKQKKINLWFLVILVIILAIAITWVIAKRQFTKAENQTQETKTSYMNEIKDIYSPQASLAEIIESRRSWNPISTSWFGKEAPDFTITDINDKIHKLSDYRGKNVMLTFWATWCGPCSMEVPHLMALRKALDEDKLVMLAITHIEPRNTIEMVKHFAMRNGINYTLVPADITTLPAPFSSIGGIPCSFFINPAGKIKLIAIGTLSFGEMKAIALAEGP